MRKLISTILVLTILPAMLCAQKVGLVMSGGGARGLAHIGVIKIPKLFSRNIQHGFT